jgi:hypothetical protein
MKPTFEDAISSNVGVVIFWIPNLKRSKNPDRLGNNDQCGYVGVFLGTIPRDQRSTTLVMIVVVWGRQYCIQSCDRQNRRGKLYPRLAPGFANVVDSELSSALGGGRNLF